MASKCAVCGETIGVLEGSATLGPSQELISVKICSNCCWHKEQLLDIRDADIHATYFAKFVDNIQNPVVKDYLIYLVDTPIREAEVIQSKQHIVDTRIIHTELLQKIMITSSHDFEGWRITEYKGFISTEAAIGMGMFKAIAASFSNMTGTESESLGNKLAEAKQTVIDRLKHIAVEVDANAIIGMNLEYTMFGESIVGVIVSGTAVTIEKVEVEGHSL